LRSLFIFRLTSQGIAAGVFQGKLDQKNCHFEVDFVIGRDIRKIDIGNIVGVLSAWCDNCDTTLSTIENQVSSYLSQASSKYVSQVEKVNKERADTIRHKAELEHRITEVISLDVRAAPLVPPGEGCCEEPGRGGRGPRLQDGQRED
jgi:hypothetical protein